MEYYFFTRTSDTFFVLPSKNNIPEANNAYLTSNFTHLQQLLL